MTTGRGFGRAQHVALHRLVVLSGLTAFVIVVYVVVVRGGGAVIGQTRSPSLPLSILATAAVALWFAPVQGQLERLAARLGVGTAPTPYEVLNQFSETTVDEDAAEDLPERMARLLAQGTGAEWAQVWLTVSDRQVLAATWPAGPSEERTPPDPKPDARDATGPGRRALSVEHDGQWLGTLRLQERPGLTLSSVERRLFRALATRAGLMLRLVVVRAELTRRHAELLRRASELKASRERLIETQDAERRRLERDLHDGAQQHLVALAVNMRLAQTLATAAPERAAQILGRQADATRVAIETLSSLSRGIYPRQLADEGLVAALESAFVTSPIPVTVTAVEVGRLPTSVEAALYFCGLEAVQNAAKHSGARAVAVHVCTELGEACLVVTDDGAGFNPADVHGAGAGLVNMRDRLDAVGGTVTVMSLPGKGTTVTARVRGRAA